MTAPRVSEYGTPRVAELLPVTWTVGATSSTVTAFVPAFANVMPSTRRSTAIVYPFGPSA